MGLTLELRCLKPSVDLQSGNESSNFLKTLLLANTAVLQENFSQLIVVPSAVTGENKSDLFNGKDGDAIKNQLMHILLIKLKRLINLNQF